MSVRDEVIMFLRTPELFISSATDPDLWLRGLDDFARPSIEATGDRSLRPAQEDAWRGLADKRAGLILGPPGTGKTHLLSWIIAGFGAARRPTQLQARTLVAAFTRNAVGNVLDAVAARQALHDPLAPRPIYFGPPPATGLAAGIDVVGRDDGRDVMDALAEGERVIGMTVWSLYRLLTKNAVAGTDGPTAPLFDLVCIDEASQLVLGQGLMALAGLAPDGRIVVAGDDKQLPPIRAGKPIKLEGRELGGSLYAFMKSVGAPEFRLEETFRLNGPLTVFPEKTFYTGRYVSQSIEDRLQLKDDWRTGLDLISRVALDPEIPLVVILHDGPTAATVNPFEVQIATRIAGQLAERLAGETVPGGPPSDFWSERLAIVSPHRAQNAAIRAALPNEIRSGAFVETVDRIQGKEREAVILSYCVADAEFALTEGEFIFSPERLNVATTRARTKLVVLVNRRLLDTVPADQELMDKAELLREFVFSCASLTSGTVHDTQGRSVPFELRVRGFDADVDVDVTPDPALLPSALVMTPAAQGVLDAIRSVANQSQWGNAALSKVKSAMARSVEPFPEARLLHGFGWIALQHKPSKNGPFWVARPYDERRRVYEADIDTVRMRIGLVVREAKSGKHAFYDRVRERFAWMGEDERDVLLDVLRTLEQEGMVTFVPVKNGFAVTMVQDEPDYTEDVALPPLPVLQDSDFALLNKLEDIEASRINFGIFDAWTSAAELTAKTAQPADEVALGLARVQAHGHLMLADDGRVRSRMAEVARELKHLKQRFRSEDAHQRPYLVRSIKVELRDRAKPNRGVPLRGVFAAAAAGASKSQIRALDCLEGALQRLWGDEPGIAGFQAEGFAKLSAAWRGEGDTTFAISADTGSGKTEAVALPIIACAMADRIDGISGTRAIFAYPRVRLATNQAQRLAHYLAACSRDPAMPTLTLGLQVADVPDRFAGMSHGYQEGWPTAGPNAFVFPFFACPACSADLILRADEGEDGADRLDCRGCGWQYDGWIGSKEKLREQPPTFFLPTTDSLHQWMHDHRAGRIFGDDEGYAPPRALVADEIHLYTHVHGAQVGLTFQRLAARSQVNDPKRWPMIAIGMSATIGDPAKAWRRLIGRDDVAVVAPAPEDARKSPRGREYFYFIQPEVESRGADIAGASTTIQALMCLGHGMRRRTGDEGGFRSLVFFDSIDKMRRLHGAFMDAEQELKLAQLRTVTYGDDATGMPQNQCCGEPVGCGHFADGECWFFAATDDRQRGARGPLRLGQSMAVAPSPIYSGSGSDAEAAVKAADVVFATSSLEVGYDDPDITLVYQHYAPQNLASFVQRKGRGGRGSDDRPTTAITLSIYSPRDSWWFRRPHEMVSPVGFETPLNPDNVFVRRGQVLSAVLDGLARYERETGTALPRGDIRIHALLAAGSFVEFVFGSNIWSEFGTDDVVAFWGAARGSVDLSGRRYLSELRRLLPWAPDLLFQTINLPSLTVQGHNVFGGVKEDVSLAFASLAPGNATRRYNPQVVHWVAPEPGLVPWFAPEDYATAERYTLRETSQQMLAELPQDVRKMLSGLHTDLCRPVSVTVEPLGRMAGATWFPDLSFSTDRSPPVRPAQDGDPTIRHDSRGTLNGFLLVSTDPAGSAPLPVDGIGGSLSSARAFIARGNREGSGLDVARVYWGADSEVVYDDRKRDPEAFAQIFADPEDGLPLLHGYQVSTEGLQLEIDAEALDQVVSACMAEMSSDERERRWRSAQYTRYLVESQARALGVNAYEAKRGADIIVAAAGDPDLRKRLVRLLEYWDPAKLGQLFEDTRAQLLGQHPLMTFRRVSRTADALASEEFRDLMKAAIAEVRDEAAMRRYLASTIVHGLALRMKVLTAFVGSGDENRLFAHAKLPIQFGGEIDHVITVAETGAGGDGTIRAVIDRWPDLSTMWREGFLRDCPNAAEDAALRRFWELRAEHAAWRTRNPRDPRVLTEIARHVSPQHTDAPLSSAINRILFGVEEIETESFALYDIASDLEAVRIRAEARFGRSAADWEIATVAVSDALSGQASHLARMHQAYSGLDGTSEEAFSPDTRLADQAYRLGTPLCQDGCRACVHQSSDMMGDSLMQSTVSRRLLERFLDHAGETRIRPSA
ncbi:AAA domain-containing protein [Sphingomonas faeni]|uniref:AAA domain-containing protein n=1 Tax=Sphingomonas faeni TaxID=185950 RepID=UPI00335E88B4